MNGSRAQVEVNVAPKWQQNFSTAHEPTIIAKMGISGVADITDASNILTLFRGISGER